MLCQAKTSKGKPCKNRALLNAGLCNVHQQLQSNIAGLIQRLPAPVSVPEVPDEKVVIIAEPGYEPEYVDTWVIIDGLRVLLLAVMVEQIVKLYKSFKQEHISVYLKGIGGVGKTFFIQAFHAYVTQIIGDKRIALTATTGKGAVIINGQTIHSWSGIGYAKTLDYYKALKYNLNWDNIDILVIDEISMLSANAFRMLDFLAREHLDYNKPFGGLSLILSGDFLQLEPIADQEDNKDTGISGTFIFDTSEWRLLNPVKILFETPYRYKDDLPFYHLLCRIRRGCPTNEDISLLNTRVCPNGKWRDKEDWEDGIRPCAIYTQRIETEKDNLRQLEKIKSQSFIFPAKEHLTNVKGDHILRMNDFGASDQKNIKNIYNDLPVDNTLHLKVGAQVMLRRNLDVEKGLCNSFPGIVTAIIDETHIKVKFYKVTEEVDLEPEKILAHIKIRQSYLGFNSQ